MKEIMRLCEEHSDLDWNYLLFAEETGECILGDKQDVFQWNDVLKKFYEQTNSSMKGGVICFFLFETHLMAVLWKTRVVSFGNLLPFRVAKVIVTQNEQDLSQEALFHLIQDLPLPSSKTRKSARRK